MVAALAVAEVVLVPRIEGEIEDRAAERVAEVAGVDAELGTFPVVARALALGEVPRVVVTLDEVASTAIRFATIRAELEGIELSRQELLNGQLDLERIDRGSLVAEVTEPDLEEALPANLADVDLSPGRVEVGVAGGTLEAEAVVRDGSLRLRLGSLPAISLPLPGVELFPCALDVEVVEDALRLSCTLDEVPQWLVRRLGDG